MAPAPLRRVLGVLPPELPPAGGGQPTILIDARPLQGPDALRGIGTYARGLLGGLAAEGLDVHVELLVDEGLPGPDVPGAYRLRGTRRRYRGRAALYEDAVALPADLDRIRPELFHSLRLALPARAPCPVAVTLHDLIPWALGGPILAGERLRHWPARRLLPRAELVIAPSQATADDAVRIGRVARERVRVVPEGLDPVFAPREGAQSRVRDRWGIERPYAIFVGALDYRKDPAGLLEAWRSAKVDAALVHAGDPGPQAPRGMPGTRSLGRVTDQELADLLTAAGCLIHASRYEGFGLPVLEAMGCGCPVVAYRNSSIPELLADAGLLVEDGRPEELGRAVARVLGDPDLGRRLSEAGRRRARSYTWARAARETVAAYRTLLGPRWPAGSR